MRAVGIAGVVLLIMAIPLLRQYRNSMALPVIGLICLAVGGLLVRWSRVNSRK